MTNLLRYMKEKSNYNTKEETVEFLGNETNWEYPKVCVNLQTDVR